MKRLAYDAVRDFELHDLIDGLNRAAAAVDAVQDGEPPHTLSLTSAAAAIGAAIRTLDDIRYALHSKAGVP
jgi:hypothetical protein